ncbi:T9SS type A sorting domain-containing protein [Aureisphaera galaxeae]|uniref:T9SS type A sorting domain-containing protein n=1 Tax=Aureisphaera galaxeae TaxID=1538023 RepID=UPI00234FC336|nr:T9SS type A sorting domain-containing protein [Aureisphaera galaxeae]MDC8002456.1 T9SS type A sorting domain-containing protein [Aureisphaera galaxeae]
MKYLYLSLFLLLSTSTSLYGQWLDWIDQTDSRIVITNINDNDDPAKVDDQEKDLAVGDFDNDGFMDLVIVRKASFSTPGAKTDLLLMNRNGVLEDETDLHIPEFLSDNTDARDVICVDVNGDTWMDLFLVSTFDDQPKLFINQGNDGNGDWQGFVDESSTRLPTLTVSIIQFCAGWAGDLTGNGAPDLYMVNYDSSGTALDVLFINDGSGNFTEEAQTRMGDLRNSSFGTGVEFHDVDNDGDLDIVKNLGLNDVAPFNDKGTIALFNNGDGTFTNWFKLPGDATYMFTAGDLNDDGMMDFYEVDDFADYVNYITGFVVDQSLTITTAALPTNRTDNWGGNVKMIDLDGDGDLDVGMSSVDTDEPPCETGEDRRYIIFENEGLNSGDLVHPYGATINPWNVSTYDHDYIDINNDGKMDMILGTCDGYQIFMQAPLLSTNESELKNEVSIYPNPTYGLLQVRLENIPAATLELYSLTGSVITSQTYDSVSNTPIEMNISSLTQSGVYFLKVNTDSGTVTKKIIVQ